jgi:hypothetical protein
MSSGGNVTLFPPRMRNTNGGMTTDLGDRIRTRLTILNGSSRSPRSHTIILLARVLQCDPRYLLGEIDVSGTPSELPASWRPQDNLFVARTVRNGWWRNTSLPEIASIGALNRPALPEYGATLQFAIEVGDKSLARRVPEGALLHILQVSDFYPYEPRHEDLVLVQRTEGGGARVEETVREVQEVDGIVELRTRHMDPIRDDIVAFDGEPHSVFRHRLLSPSGDWVEILGHVAFAYLPVGNFPLFERLAEPRMRPR